MKARECRNSITNEKTEKNAQIQNGNAIQSFSIVSMIYLPVKPKQYTVSWEELGSEPDPLMSPMRLRLQYFKKEYVLSLPLFKPCEVFLVTLHFTGCSRLDDNI